MLRWLSPNISSKNPNSVTSKAIGTTCSAANHIHAALCLPQFFKITAVLRSRCAANYDATRWTNMLMANELFCAC